MDCGTRFTHVIDVSNKTFNKYLSKMFTLGTITRGHGIGSVLSSAELSTAIPLHTQKASILVKSQARIFGPPPSDQFCKKSEKFRIDSEWPETARNRKKNISP